ncbi:hypothetical protein [Empedobacter falsenii]
MIPVIYLLDQIPFKNYNVYVSDSSNLFDKASIKENQKKDWSDEHGYDIDLQSRYHNSKTITIDCFIPANSLKECIEKYNNFFNALDQKGSRRLSVIAGDLRMEYQVFRQDTAENKVIYDDSNAAGTFKLKLIENMPVKRVLKSYNQPFIKLFQDYFHEYLNNIQLNGRNLLINSKESKNGIIVRIDCINLMTEGYYTFSFSNNAQNADNITVQLYDEAIGNTATGVPADIGKFLSVGQRYIYTINLLNNTKYTHFYINSNTNSLLDLKYFKLEKGNKSTDWTPAPEDVVKSNMDFLNQISIDNVIEVTEKAQLKNKVDEIKNQFNEMISKQSISNNLQIRYNEMIAFSDFILKDLDSIFTVNSKFASITLKSKKVLVINWGDGTEEYTSPYKEVYSHRYTNSEIYFPMILGDLDSITLFNTNADVLWSRF